MSIDPSRDVAAQKQWCWTCKHGQKSYGDLQYLGDTVKTLRACSLVPMQGAHEEWWDTWVCGLGDEDARADGPVPACPAFDLDAQRMMRWYRERDLALDPAGPGEGYDVIGTIVAEDTPAAPPRRFVANGLTVTVTLPDGEKRVLTGVNFAAHAPVPPQVVVNVTGTKLRAESLFELIQKEILTPDEELRDRVLNRLTRAADIIFGETE